MDIDTWVLDLDNTLYPAIAQTELWLRALRPEHQVDLPAK